MTINLDTYPPMFIKGKENENYDNELLEFTIPVDYLLNIIDESYFVTFEEFLTRYDWDDTWFIYESALADKKVISERRIPR